MMAKRKAVAAAAVAAPPINSPADFDRAAVRAIAYLSRPLVLKEIPLPAGVINGINIGWWSNGAQITLNPNLWLGQSDPQGRPYVGVRLIGKGIGRTAIKQAPGDGNSLAVIRHNGVVQLESVDLICGRRGATQFGEQNLDFTKWNANGSPVYGSQRLTCPLFTFRLYRSRVIAPPPSELGGLRATWGLFSYQADEHLQDVEIDLTEALEHNYQHGNASRGSLWQRVRVHGAGSEDDKNRSDMSETAWAGPNVWTIRQNCVFKNWGQPHGNYSTGGGSVRQNPAAHQLFEDSAFIGRDGHPGCIMISSEGNSYGIDHGWQTNDFGNGFVVIRRCGLTGMQSAGFWRNEIVSVYRNAGSNKAAKGFLMEECAVYGRNTILKLAEMPAGTVFVRNCNRPEDRERAQAIGIDTTYETTIPTANRLVPVSEGYSR